MAFFNYDKEKDREWIEIELHPGTPISRAEIQDYARCMNVKPENWVQDALVWFMHECDRQGAHTPPTPVKKPSEKAQVPQWKKQVADRLYGMAMRLDGTEDADEQTY